jgi:hypothetical protein
MIGLKEPTSLAASQFDHIERKLVPGEATLNTGLGPALASRREGTIQEFPCKLLDGSGVLGAFLRFLQRTDPFPTRRPFFQ